MAQLESELKDKVDGLIDKAMSGFDPNNIQNAISTLKEAWELLPEPKYKWSDSFLISKYLTHVYFNQNQFDNALDWAKIFNQCDPGRDYGESEFMLAKVLYQKNNKEEAKEKFKVADQKSDGRVWKGEKNLDYFKFFKGK
ncbi:tetratricopeptide repeat protein [Aquimarina brevivitae]|uniref:Tetratricopeptide repeat protein n=1 Tax=Aquimarina brevivitae TaxID=323412 RepID=A0A4V2F5E1_9FLAO|nr:hypothetical protein [Aquimarina brevivitae]RZS92499.1 hypothetical protein EV197_2637 [Aquimarina brevivitae]